MNIGDTVSLADKRDGKVYPVSKLADEKCWMTADLKLGNPSGTLTLTHEDTNLGTADSGDYTLPAQNTGTWCQSYSGSCFRQNNWIVSTNAEESYIYNWYTATGGPTSNIGYNTTNPSGDICPKGWQLPSGGSSSDFRNLDVAMGGTGTNRTDAAARDRFMNSYTAAPVKMNYTGYRSGGSTDSTTTAAFYLSRTVVDSDYAYYLYFSSSGNLSPQYYTSKYFGFAMRCVAK